MITWWGGWVAQWPGLPVSWYLQSKRGRGGSELTDPSMPHAVPEEGHEQHPQRHKPSQARGHLQASVWQAPACLPHSRCCKPAW